MLNIKYLLKLYKECNTGIQETFIRIYFFPIKFTKFYNKTMNVSHDKPPPSYNESENHPGTTDQQEANNNVPLLQVNSENITSNIGSNTNSRSTAAAVNPNTSGENNINNRRKSKLNLCISVISLSLITFIILLFFYFGIISENSDDFSTNSASQEDYNSWSNDSCPAGQEYDYDYSTCKDKQCICMHQKSNISDINFLKWRFNEESLGHTGVNCHFDNIAKSYGSAFTYLPTFDMYSSCKSCLKGYHIVNGTKQDQGTPSSCWENKCYCKMGSEATGKDCLHKTDNCKTCPHGHYINDMQVSKAAKEPFPNGFTFTPNNPQKLHKCFPRYCTCNNGKPGKLSSCPLHNHENCVSCDKGYYLGRKLNREILDQTELSFFGCFKSRNCGCENGIGGSGLNCHFGPELELSGSLTEQNFKLSNCTACSEGYFLDSSTFTSTSKPPTSTQFTCTKNRTCICDSGTPALNKNCPKNGSHFCQSCTNPLERVQLDGTCQENICYCKNGVPSLGQKCFKNGAHDCAKCDKGFRPSIGSGETDRGGFYITQMCVEN